ncbi:MAG TPA: GNVR domain-containing protein [Steroidobacteraceae bacterium]|nr:GNVR domain-containing protein [Steroidobacteraceae bacterium]
MSETGIPQTGDPPEGVIDIASLLAAFSRSYVRLGLIVVACTLLGAAYAFTADRYYRSEAQLVVERGPAAGGGLAALASQVTGLGQLGALGLGSTERGEVMALLESRALAERVIVRHKLMDILYPPGERDPGAKAPSMWLAVQKFTRSVIAVDDNRLTGVITVSCEWTDPKLAAQWANLVVSEVNLVSRERAIADADRGIGFLQQELAKTQSVEVQQAIYRLIESQMSQRMLANVRTDYIVKVIDPAMVPERPSKPKRPLVVAGSMLFGCFIAAVTVLVMAARGSRRRPAKPGR